METYTSVECHTTIASIMKIITYYSICFDFGISASEIWSWLKWRTEINESMHFHRCAKKNKMTSSAFKISLSTKLCKIFCCSFCAPYACIYLDKMQSYPSQAMFLFTQSWRMQTLAYRLLLTHINPFYIVWILSFILHTYLSYQWFATDKPITIDSFWHWFSCVQMNHDLLISFSFFHCAIEWFFFHFKQFLKLKSATHKKHTKQTNEQFDWINDNCIEMQTPFPYIFDDLLNFVLNNSNRYKVQSYAILLCSSIEWERER